MQPEDAAKDMNLKPADWFESGNPDKKPPMGYGQARGPVVIVSYGADSTPGTAAFHKGHFDLANVDTDATGKQYGGEWKKAIAEGDERPAGDSIPAEHVKGKGIPKGSHVISGMASASGSQVSEWGKDLGWVSVPQVKH